MSVYEWHIPHKRARVFVQALSKGQARQAAAAYFRALPATEGRMWTDTIMAVAPVEYPKMTTLDVCGIDKTVVVLVEDNPE